MRSFGVVSREKAVMGAGGAETWRALRARKARGTLLALVGDVVLGETPPGLSRSEGSGWRARRERARSAQKARSGARRRKSPASPKPPGVFQGWPLS